MKLWKVLARNSHVYASHCNNGLELQEFKSRSPTFSEDSGKHSSGSLLQYSIHHELLTTVVQLHKIPGESLGIVLAPGPCDSDQCPSIAALRPGSMAHHSDQLVPGDRLHSVNGINTARMRTEDINNLLDNVDETALLEVEYAIPNYASQNSLCVTSKIANITIERIDGSLGITLRGGLIPEHPHLSRPLIVTYVRPHGPAHRNGLLKIGDRLLRVDNHSLTNKTLLEAQQILQQDAACNSFTTLTVEYDVSVMESVKYATGPLLVEIDRPTCEDLGLTLTSCSDFGAEEIMTAGLFVENVTPASIADRCGALHAGDQVLAIDDFSAEDGRIGPMEAEKMLRNATKLRILPQHALRRNTSRYFTGPYASSPTMSGFSTINSKCRTRNRTYRQSVVPKSDQDSGSIQGSNYCGWTNNMGVCHSETLILTLVAEKGCGYGLSVSVTAEYSEHRPADIIITRIVPESPAYRCGCFQVGDRILAVNHQQNLTVQEINSLLELGNDPNSNAKIVLHVEFDVADTIVPSSGIFTVKLAKRGPGLGITITASKNLPEEPFIISDIRRGSIAHRMGTLNAGDRLLAIDNIPLDHISLESAFKILQTSTNDIVTLKIQKVENSEDLDKSEPEEQCVVYTVELLRCGGPLGITISGSEDCMEPIVLSRLTEGGLAEKTGALHIADRILAINGESLERRPLSDAIRLLQNAGDRVQLKISRSVKNPDNSPDEQRCKYSSPGLMSTDSAVDSWDSAAMMETNLENGSNDPNATLKDTESILSDLTDYQQMNAKMSTASSRRKHDSQLQYYSDVEDIFCPSPLPLPNYSFTNTLKYETPFYGGGGGIGISNFNKSDYKLGGSGSGIAGQAASDNFSDDSLLDNEIYHVTLYKDSIYDDYGFSVSDGLYEKGVYINRIRKGGPADIVALLKPYDRILQVNDTKTKDFDCCLTVPLIASAGDKIELVVSRNPNINYSSEKDFPFSAWMPEDQDRTIKQNQFSSSQNTITKTL